MRLLVAWLTLVPLLLTLLILQCGLEHPVVYSSTRQPLALVMGSVSSAVAPPSSTNMVTESAGATLAR